MPWHRKLLATNAYTYNEQQEKIAGENEQLASNLMLVKVIIYIILLLMLMSALKQKMDEYADYGELVKCGISILRKYNVSIL